MRRPPASRPAPTTRPRSARERAPHPPGQRDEHEGPPLVVLGHEESIRMGVDQERPLLEVDGHREGVTVFPKASQERTPDAQRGSAVRGPFLDPGQRLYEGANLG